MWYVLCVSSCIAISKEKKKLIHQSPHKLIRIPDTGKFLLVESEIQDFGFWNLAQGFRNQTKDWNPENKSN